MNRPARHVRGVKAQAVIVRRRRVALAAAALAATAALQSKAVADLNWIGATVAVGSTGTALPLAISDSLSVAYWQGGLGSGGSATWKTVSGGSSNFTTDVGGASATNQLVGSTTDVHFSVTGGGSNLNTVLGTTFSIQGLYIDSTATGAVTIGGSNQLTIGADGITVAGGAAPATISAPVDLGASQTWTINGSPLTVSGSILGSQSISKAGTGALILSGTNSFSSGITLSAGLLEFNSSRAIGNGSLTIAGGSLDNTSGGAITNSTGTGMYWSGNFTFVGTNSLDMSTAFVTLGGNIAVTIAASTLSIGGQIHGLGDSLTKNGAGTLALGQFAQSTINGGTTINGGVIQYGSTAALGIGGAQSILVNSGGAAAFTGSGGITNAGFLFQLSTSSSGALALSSVDAGSALDFTNSPLSSYPTMSIGAVGNVTYTGTYTPAGSVYRLGGGNGILNYQPAIAGAASVLIGNSGSGGVVALATSNAYSGGTTINGSTLAINSTSAIGTGTLTINAGGLDNTSGGPVTLSTNNPQAWNGDFTYVGSGGSLNLGTGAVTVNASRTLTVNANTLSVGGNIAATTYSLTKAGAGTLALGGNNSYSGATNVNAGTLGVTGGSLASPLIAVAAAGALSLSPTLGTYSYAGNITLSSGSFLDMVDGQLDVVDLTATGTPLTIGAATGTAPQLTFEIANAASGTDLLRLDHGAASIGASGARIMIASLAADTSLTSGNYTLITATGGLGTGSISLASPGITVNSINYALSLTASTSTAEILTVSLGGVNTLYWQGGQSTTWTTVNGGQGNFTTDQTGTTNSGGSLPATLTDVHFTTSGGGSNLNTVLGQNFSIKGIYFDSTATSPVNIGGANTLTIGSDAITAVSGSASHTISAPVLLGNSQTWTVNNPTLTVSGPVSDGGSTFSITKAGSGTLVLSGSNTYSGGTTLAAGTLAANNAAALGTGTFTISGGSLDNSTGASLTLSTNNAQAWNGDFTFVGTNSLNIGTGAVTLGGNRVVTVSAGTLVVGGTIAGTGTTLTKSGGGTLLLTGTNTYSGATTVNAGAFDLSSAAQLSTPSIAVNGGATLSARAAAFTLGYGGAITLSTGSFFDMADGNIGTFALSGSGTAITLGAASGTAPVLTFEIGNATVGTDAIHAVNGAVLVLGSGASVAFTPLAADTSLTPGNYTFITATAGLGTSGLSLAATTVAVNGSSYNLSLANSTAVGEILNISLSPQNTLYWQGTQSRTWTNVNTGSSNFTFDQAGTINSGSLLPISTTDVHFTTTGGGSNLNTTLGANTSIKGLYFDSTATASVTVGGTSTLTIGVDGITAASGSASHTISAPVSLIATQTWSINNPTLTVSGVVSGSGFGLNKTGGGDLALSATNTYSGGTTLSAGVLEINSGSAIGSGILTIAGGNLDNASGGTLSLSTNNTQNWNADFTFLGSSSLNLGTGTVMISASRTVTANANTLTIGGGVGGSTFGLTKAGAGTLLLSGSNSYTGPTTITAGTLALLGTTTGLGGSPLTSTSVTVNGGANLSMRPIGSLNYGGTITLNPGSSFDMLDNAITTMSLTGSGTTLAVGASSGSPVTMTFEIGNNSLGTDRIQLTNGAASILASGVSLSLSPLANDTTITANNYTVISAINGLGTASFSLASPTLVVNGTTYDLSLANSTSTAEVVTVGTPLPTAYWQGGQGSAGNATWTTINAGSSNFTRDQDGAINTGTSLPDANTDLHFSTSDGGSNLNTILGANISVKGLYFDSTATTPVTIGGNNTLTIGNDGINAASGSASHTISAPVGFSNLGTWTINNPTLTVSGSISGFDLTKAGTGALVLSGSNTFGGVTQLQGGSLDLNNRYALGVSTLDINGGNIDNTSGEPVTLSAASAVEFGSNFTFVGTNLLSLGTESVFVVGGPTVTVAASTLTVAGPIAGPTSGMSKAGAGTLILSGSNNYTGGTTLSAGVLGIDSRFALSTGTLTIAGGNFDNLSGSPLTLATANVQIWNSDAVFSGTSSLDMGTGTVVFSANRTVTVGANTLAIAGPISGGTASLTKAGAGTLALGASNSYSGGTTLSAGILGINNPAALGTGALTIAGGGLDNCGPADVTLITNNLQSWNADFSFVGTQNLNLGTGAVAFSSARTLNVVAHTLNVAGSIDAGTASLTKIGAGTLVLAGSNSYSGGTILSAGTLVFGNPNSIGTGALSIGGGGLDNGSGAIMTLATSNAQIWQGGFSYIGTNNLNMGTGGITLSPGVSVTVLNNTLTVGGVVSGTGNGLIKLGAGTLVLNGSNTFTGATTITAGTIQYGSLASLGAATGASIHVGSAGAAAFAGSGGVLNTGFISQINASTGGALALSSIDANSNLDFTNGPLASFPTMALGAVGTTSYTGSYSPAGNIYRLGGGSGTLVYEPTIPATASVIIGNLGSAGAVVLAASNSYSGGTTLNGSTLAINTSAEIGSGLLTFNGGAIDNTSGSAVSLGSNNTQAWDANFEFVGTNNLDLGIGPVSLGSLVTVTVDAGTLSDEGNISGSAGPATVPAAISDTTPTGLTKSGPGTFVLGGSNGYSGPTTINCGTLIASGPYAIPLASPVVNNAAFVVTATGTPVSIAGISGTGITTVSSGVKMTTAALTQNSLVINGDLTINGTGALGAPSSSTPPLTGTGSLTLGSSASIAIATSQSGTTSAIGSLTLNGNGTLDIANNIVSVSEATTSKATIQGYIQSGYASGNWNGPGINSSAAASNAGRGIGYADNADGTVAGLPANTIQVRYTLYGDVNLDGTVTIGDAGIFLPNFNQPGSFDWAHGDFNYDGHVTIGDMGLAMPNFNQSLNASGLVALAGSKSANSSAAARPSVEYILSRNDNGHGVFTPGAFAVYAVDSTADGNSGLALYGVALTGMSSITNLSPTSQTGSSVAGFYSFRSASDTAVPISGFQSAIGTGDTFTPIYSLGQDGQMLLATGTFSGSVAFNALTTNDVADVFTDSVGDLGAQLNVGNGEIVLATQNLAPVPEPAAAGLLAIGALGLLTRRRKRGLSD